MKFRMQLEPKRLLFYQHFLQSQENVVLLNSASIQLSVPFKKKKNQFHCSYTETGNFPGIFSDHYFFFFEYDA